MTYTDGGIVEIVKRNDGANVDESSAIEQQIDDVGKHGVLSVFVKESIPCESCTTRKSREEVVTPQQGRNT